MNRDKGFVTILTGLYSFQDCIHFLASVRKFHQEPILILIDQVPVIFHPLLKSFGNVILQQSPADPNPVLASRRAKIALYERSPFQKTIFLDCDICLLTDIDDLFEKLDHVDFLITEDIQPAIPLASNLLRVKEPILPTLQSVGLPLNEHSIQYNTGLMAFRRSETNAALFQHFQQCFEKILAHQDVLLLRDQGAFAAAVEMTQPNLHILPPSYNFLDKWKDHYGVMQEPIKVLHCTYPYRPQYAKNVTRSLPLRIFDRLAKVFLPNQVNNPWRLQKAKSPGA
ncbi:MAG: hypothetical protein HC827_11395 [Cyanobacteria bacterium RM1_2_2]|nr:hypothetical protein [Cyanobacteria bacterium RM1_2_2]